METGGNKVSIIVPCFNAQRTIKETIESALKQTDIDFEIVVIDDGSVDKSLSIIRIFEPEVRVISGPNQGVSIARNKGIAETNGEWIIFLDSDDLLCESTIEKRLQIARQSNADVIITDWQDFSEDQEGDIRLLESHRIDWDALANNAEIACATHVWATTGAIMYRRSMVEKIGGFREDLPVIQDARFLFDAAFHGAKFAHAPHCGSYYRIQDNSLSRRSFAEFWLDVLRNGEQIEALWQSNSDSLSFEKRQALADIFNGATNALLRIGHPKAFQAYSRLNIYSEKESWKLYCGFALMRLFGGSTVRFLFRIGKIIKHMDWKSEARVGF